MVLTTNPARALKRACMLIVEDDFLIYMNLEITLTAAGARIEQHCSSIEEAQTFIAGPRIRRIKPGRQLIAVLDIRLWDGTSLSLAHRLREKRIPFLFYSGRGDWQAVKREFSEAPRLAKPAYPADLVGAVGGLLRRSSASANQPN